MEYMPQGDLHAFLLTTTTVTETQRLRWAKEAAEALQLLHTAGVLHCDIHPKNFLLDAHLGLKIADFGGSSLAGSKPSAYSGPRFTIPDQNWRDPPTVQDDLFALGSTIYFIMTGQLPFPELSEDEVEENYRNGRFPDVSEIICGELIQQCWKSQVASAQDMYNFIGGITRHGQSDC
jgi:serine/threonine protein kinase